MQKFAHTTENRRPEIISLCGILILYAIALGVYFVPVVGSTDANGYQVSARMLDLYGRFYRLPADAFSFVGYMWVANDRGELYPKYPPGYPAVAGLALKLFGDPAGLLISPLAAWLAILGVYVACRTQLPGWASVLGAWIVATLPLLNFFAVDQLSHASGVAAATWGYAFFFLAKRDSERPRLGLLFASGLLIGFTASIRYPEILLALPPILWLLLRHKTDGKAPTVAWLAGLAIPCAALAAYHWVSFGHPLRTGYAMTQEQTSFSASYLLHNLRYYGPAIVTDAFGPLFILSGCGLLVKWHRDWRDGLFYTAWTVPLVALYASYYYLPEDAEWMYMRFLLPLGLPSVILALDFVRDRVPESERSHKRMIVVALLLCQGAWGVFLSLRWMERRYSFNEVQRRTVEFVRAHAQKGSVVFGASNLLDDLDYRQEYILYVNDLLDQERVRTSRENFKGKNPYRRMQFSEIVDLDEESYRKRIRELIDLRLSEGRAVYVAGNEESQERFAAAYSPHYEIVQTGNLPAVRRLPYRLFAADMAEVSGRGALRLVRIQPHPR